MGNDVSVTFLIVIHAFVEISGDPSDNITALPLVQLDAVSANTREGAADCCEANVTSGTLVIAQTIGVELSICSAFDGYVCQVNSDRGKRPFACAAAAATTIISERAVRDVNAVVCNAGNGHFIQY